MIAHMIRQKASVCHDMIPAHSGDHGLISDVYPKDLRPLKEKELIISTSVIKTPDRK